MHCVAGIYFETLYLVKNAYEKLLDKFIFCYKIVLNRTKKEQKIENMSNTFLSCKNMIPLNPWEHQNAVKTLYAKCVEKICIRHDITRMELDILLFLANNPCFDTATDIIEIRYLSKSQVSVSIKTLEKSGYIRKEYTGQNRKTAHLKLCEAAMPIIRDGRAAQEKFLDIMLKGFSQDEIDTMKQFSKQMRHNINAYMKEESGDV